MPAFKNEIRDLEKAAKVANQAMRRLEASGLTGSPAYRAAQAWLITQGVKPTKNGARRFPEHYGRMSEEEFLSFQQAVEQYRKPGGTGTRAGFRKMLSDVYEMGDSQYGLRDAGISKEDYFNFWSSLPDNKRDRVYGSDVYITILIAAYIKGGDVEINRKRAKDSTIDGKSLADRIERSNSLTDALKRVGLTMDDFSYAHMYIEKKL